MSKDIPFAKVECTEDQSLPFAHEAVHHPEPSMPPPPVPPPVPEFGTTSTFPSAPPGTTSTFPSAPPLEEQEQPGESKENHYECPVCFESIAPASATMRCDGSGGRPHYFHAECLGSWIESCQRQGNTATCPCCRGGVQVHTQRLEQFLQSTTETETNTINLTVGRRILQSLQSAQNTVSSGWNKIPALNELTTEDVVEGASVVAGAGIGFWAGANGEALSTGNWMMDNELWARSSTTTKVVTIVGYTSGVLYRWWSSSNAREEEEEEHRNRGGSGGRRRR